MTTKLPLSFLRVPPEWKRAAERGRVALYLSSWLTLPTAVWLVVADELKLLAAGIIGAALMPLVEVRHLVKEFAGKQGLRRRGAPVRAVDDVSFSIEEGETFGLVGESGSGKTTTGRCILRLIEPTSGEVLFRDRNLLELSAREMRRVRRQMQIVFQDPYSSLNPRMRVGTIVEEPLVIHRMGTGPEPSSKSHWPTRPCVMPVITIKWASNSNTSIPKNSKKTTPRWETILRGVQVF